MFGGGTSLFGSSATEATTTVSPGGAFGSSQQHQQTQLSPFGGSFGTPGQQKTPQTSLFATPSQVGATKSLFGATNTQAGSASFGTAYAGTTANELTKNFPGSTGSTWQSFGPTSSFLFPQQAVPQPLQQSFIAPEIQPILSNLSNADSRSCQVLTEIYSRLKAFTTEKPTLIAFTYEVDFDAASLQQKQLVLEQQLMQLNDAHIVELYTVARRQNPDPAK